MDETGEIRATAFNSAVDQLYDLLEEGKASERCLFSIKFYLSDITGFLHHQGEGRIGQEEFFQRQQRLRDNI